MRISTCIDVGMTLENPILGLSVLLRGKDDTNSATRDDNIQNTINDDVEIPPLSLEKVKVEILRLEDKKDTGPNKLEEEWRKICLTIETSVSSVLS